MKYQLNLGRNKMKKDTKKYIDELCLRYENLKMVKTSVEQTIERIIEIYKNGNKIMVCGNGGSAADSLHIVGELMKSFVLPRPISDTVANKIKKCSSNSEYLLKNLQMALPIISLVNEVGLMTAYANDVAADLNFAQQVLGQGKAGDILLAISTSGNSKNVIYAAEIAKAMNINVIGLTGKSGGKLGKIADILINVPESETYKIQELHLPVYHTICLAVEAEFYAGK